MHIDTFLSEFSSFLIGVTIVFVTLLLLIFLINVLSKVVGFIENRNKVQPVPVATPEPITVIEEESVDVTDELELVAVITATIAASMGTTTDKLQVRSLRQVTRRK